MGKRIYNKVNIKATTKEAMPMCWVKEGKSYTLMRKGGRPANRNLPSVSAKYEEVLKSLEVPYELVELPNRYKEGETYTACVYWHPDLQETEEANFPVYEAMAGTEDVYVNTGKRHTETVFTYATIAKALEAKKTVSQAVQLYETNQKLVRKEKFLRRQLGDCSARVIEGKFDDKETVDGIKVLAAYNTSGSKNGYYAIFDTKKLENVLNVRLKVAKETAFKVIGKDGANVQYWEYELGKKITIIPV